MSHDCMSLWLSDILLGKHPMCHSSIYGYTMPVCCKYPYCTCAEPGNTGQSQSHDITCNTFICTLFKEMQYFSEVFSYICISVRDSYSKKDQGVYLCPEKNTMQL